MTHDSLNGHPSQSKTPSSIVNPIPLFSESRHEQVRAKPEQIKAKWRVKERMKTFSVALILCLNPGVDPPDTTFKSANSAKLESWIDPVSSAKAVENIGKSLQQQYERWQPKARFKISIEPTTDEVKKVCVSLRKQAQDDRVLFHYNGHGVPKPTKNGEIWIFNKDYTQYIPLSIYDLLIWMGAPSVFVWDCAYAGLVVKWYNNFAKQRKEDQAKFGSGITHIPDFEANSIHLAACSEGELLPIDPDMPADLFTATLTMPIKVSILSFSCKNKGVVPWAAGVTLEKIDALPGKISDRRSLVGELNWVFTAITDTIAWTSLPRDLFLRLFRQDLLVASLFRNFLFADRVMRQYSCVPVSHPKLRPTYKHHLWLSWESTLDSLLKEMSLFKDCPPQSNPLLRSHSTEFFSEQMKCFARCVQTCGYPESSYPPEQLPILLQVLLSKAERLSALNLLSTFMDQGSVAVHLVLSVGIFPYVLKLLHSSFVELKRLMIFIWAKVLAVEPDCKVDLVREKSFEYFVNAIKDGNLESEYRAMACFVLSSICDEYPLGNEACFNIELGFVCLSQLEGCSQSQSPHPFLLQWLCLCLSRFWQGSEHAILSAHRSSAHEKLYPLVSHHSPEVRASAISALSALINQSHVSTQKCDTISHNIMSLLIDVGQRDASPLVRREVVASMSVFIAQLEQQFYDTLAEAIDTFNKAQPPYSDDNILTNTIMGEWVRVTDANKHLHISELHTDSEGIDLNCNGNSLLATSLPRSSSWEMVLTSSLLRNPTIRSPNNIYLHIWSSLFVLTEDSCESVCVLAKELFSGVLSKLNLLWRSNYSGSEEKNATKKSDPLIKLPDATEPPSTSLPDSGLYTWSSRYFTKPFLNAQSGLAIEIDPFLKSYYDKRKEFSTPGSDLVDSTASDKKNDSQKLQEKLDTAISLSCINSGERAVAMKFHPLESNLAVATDKLVNLYNFAPSPSSLFTTPLAPSLSFKGVSSQNSRLMAVEYLNPVHYPLLLTVEDNGNIRVWKDIELFPNHQQLEDRTPTVVSGWRGISSLTARNTCKSLSLKCQQSSGLLFLAANEPSVDVWDLRCEMLKQTISIPSKINVSCLALHPSSPDLFLTGDVEGYILLFDLRESNFPVWSMSMHSSAVLNISMLTAAKLKFASSGADEILVSDFHTRSPLHRFSTGLRDLTSVDVHPTSNLAAITGLNSTDILFLSTLSPSFEPCHLKNRSAGPDPVRNSRHKVKLQFHPFKPWLAAGCEQEIKIYSLMDGFTLHRAHVID